MVDNVTYLERSLSDNMKVNPAYAIVGSDSGYYKGEPKTIPAQMDMDYSVSNLSGSDEYEHMSPVMLETTAKEMVAKQQFETENTSDSDYEDIPL